VSAVVDGQSTEAARDSPAAAPALEPPAAVILGAPVDESAGDSALVGPDYLTEEAEVIEEADGAEEAEEADLLDSASDDAGQEPDRGDEGGNGGKCGNVAADGEPPDGGGRLTGVTATLSESALLPEIAPADEALAPETLATSAFDAEEPREPAVWAAADVVTEIYHGHYNQLVRLAVLLVHDVQTAEEVVQDAFEAMHLASRRLRDSEKALQYLRQTVVNRSRSVLRHRKVVDMHAPKPAPDEPSAEHAALAILERSAVAAALRSLPGRQREAIALRYYADFSEADIAKAMGISKGAVKSHTARAMASLKTILTQETS
jgi:RNA polymerase sigma-70 factor (sigma-E family)